MDLVSQKMSKKKYFIIDFDSTFTQVEALDILAEISLKGSEDRDKAVEEIKKITDLGMDGSMSFRETLDQRLAILKGNKQHLQELINRLSGFVSKSFQRNTDFILNTREQIYIVSNGFKDFIVPIVEKYGILEENVFANEFTYDEEGNITGFDETNLLSESGGKPKQIEKRKRFISCNVVYI